MKLLFDENLSYRLVELLSDIYPGSTHVRDAGLLGEPDASIWELAKQNGYVVVSKDADFYQRSLVLGHPPKTVWLQVGNAPTKAISLLLRANAILLRRFIEDEDAAVIVLRRA